MHAYRKCEKHLSNINASKPTINIEDAYLHVEHVHAQMFSLFNQPCCKLNLIRVFLGEIKTTS